MMKEVFCRKLNKVTGCEMTEAFWSLFNRISLLLKSWPCNYKDNENRQSYACERTIGEATLDQVWAVQREIVKGEKESNGTNDEQ